MYSVGSEICSSPHLLPFRLLQFFKLYSTSGMRSLLCGPGLFFFTEKRFTGRGHFLSCEGWNSQSRSSLTALARWPVAADAPYPVATYRRSSTLPQDSQEARHGHGPSLRGYAPSPDWPRALAGPLPDIAVLLLRALIKLVLMVHGIAPWRVDWLTSTNRQVKITRPREAWTHPTAAPADGHDPEALDPVSIGFRRRLCVSFFVGLEKPRLAVKKWNWYSPLGLRVGPWLRASAAQVSGFSESLCHR
jgi:hypothetical protein